MSVYREHAKRLYNALKTGELLPPLRQDIDNEIPAAYAIQEAFTELRLADGERIVGKKIGLTSPAVQAQLGVDQPDYGMLYDSMAVTSGSAISMEELQQPKVEGELAFVLGADLLGPEITMAELCSAISEVRASIEIVGSRIENWDIQISDTVADNASASHYVLGDDSQELSQINTVTATMKLYKNGALSSEGSGAACMGDPLNAALWLAQKMAKNNRPLLKGEVLLSGALGPMVPVVKGDEFTLQIDGFQDVEISFY